MVLVLICLVGECVLPLGIVGVKVVARGRMFCLLCYEVKRVATSDCPLPVFYTYTHYIWVLLNLQSGISGLFIGQIGIMALPPLVRRSYNTSRGQSDVATLFGLDLQSCISIVLWFIACSGTSIICEVHDEFSFLILVFSYQGLQLQLAVQFIPLT